MIILLYYPLNYFKIKFDFSPKMFINNMLPKLHLNNLHNHLIRVRRKLMITLFFNGH